jgi:hypothetical protein
MCTVALLAGLSAWVLPGSAAAAARASMVRAAASAPAPARASRLSEAQAELRARRTDRPVVASALTTPNSMTTALPDGKFRATETLKPTRIWFGGDWHSLNADLYVTKDRTVVPAVTTSPVSLSDGGSSLLAVLISAGRTMTVYWPGTLPAPVLSGSTATYRSVLPGVDLRVMVSPQGGFSDVLIVKNAAAAASLRLASIKLRMVTPGLHIYSHPGGNLTVATSRTAAPVFSTPPALQWDSARPKPRTRIVHGPGGQLLAAPSGAPAYSSAASPGAGAKVVPLPIKVSGDTITLQPSRDGLRGGHVSYPAYLDPTFAPDPSSSKLASWTQVDQGFATTNYLNESSDLQVGDCDNSSGGCNGLGVARSFMNFAIPPGLTKASHVDDATIDMNDVWATSCTAQPTDLWNTGAFGSHTTWNSQPSWGTKLQEKSFAFGAGSNCGSFKNDVAWTVTSTLQNDAGVASSQNFGMRAADETQPLQWKQFASGSGNMTLSVEYHTAPNKPADLANSPAGPCSASASSPADIGADDVTLSALVGDIDNGFGDSSLSTTFTLKNVSSGTTADTITVSTGNAVGGTIASTTLTRTTMEGLNTGGSMTPFTYSWSAVTKDAGSPVLTSPASENCYFTYDPTAPAAPTVVATPSSAAIGSTVSVTITPPSDCGTSGNPSCPVSYTYQVGVGAPVTVTPNNNPATGDWTGNVTITQFGPGSVNVYGTASNGNLSAIDSTELDGTRPAAPYLDGHYTGGAYPDLLSLGTGADPSLWLSPGTANGTLGPAVDIGSLGLATNPGSDGPADWAGNQVTHGDFTGLGVQDALAYNPSTGNGEIVTGSGTAASLQPNGNVATFFGGTLVDPNVNGGSDNAIDVVAAGDASELCPSMDDLVGIAGDAASGYELDLWTTASPDGFGTAGGYGFVQPLATTAPDGSPDWQNYTLATAQLPDSGDQVGCANPTTEAISNPDDVALFALNKTTGAIYETTNPNVNANQSQSLASNTAVGSGTWTQLSIPWGNTAPNLVSADVNNAGSPELWALASGTATPYTVSGTTVSKEGAGSPVSNASHDWALDDGSSAAQAGQSAVTTATDSVTGKTASLNGSASWLDDPYFGTTLNLDGSTGTDVSATESAVNPDADFTMSLWARPNQLGGTVVSQNMTKAASVRVFADSSGRWEACMATSDTSSAAYDCAVGGAVNLKAWTELTVTYSASAKLLNLYDAGVNVAYVEHAPLSGAPSGNFQIGDYLSSGSPTGFFDGQVSNVKAWASVTGPDEASSAPGYYQQITPARMLNTISGVGAPTGPVAAGGNVTLQVAGTNGIPSTGVTAVVMTLTATNESSAGTVHVDPSEAPEAITSTLNYSAGTPTSNLVIAPLGPNGAITITNASSGTTQFLGDVSGYFTTNASMAGDSTFTPMTGTRILDTRNGIGAPKAQVSAGQTMTLQVSGANGIPSGATAVALNTAAINDSGGGLLTEYADGTSRPPVSGLQFQTSTVADQQIVPIGSNGKIDIYVGGTGATDLLGDALGYFMPGTSGEVYHTISDSRIIDTRTSSPDTSDGTLAVHQPADIQASNPVMIVNVTADDGTSHGFITDHAGGTSLPPTSNVNYSAGTGLAGAWPNLVLAQASGGVTDLYNGSTGTVDLIVDVMGYFSSS